MNYFVDTSAFYAVMDSSDGYHAKASQLWGDLVEEGAVLRTTNYVILETVSLLQARFGIAAVRLLHNDIIPVLDLIWVNEQAHKTAVESLFISAKRELSLVDCVSFQSMQTSGIETAFAFDRHFKERGFKIVP